MISTSDYWQFDARGSLEAHSHAIPASLQRVADETRNSLLDTFSPWCCEPCKIASFFKVPYYPSGVQNPPEF
jgi:hypothetical protein